MKPTTPYGNLPLLTIAGAEPVAQSDAMLKYVGRLATKHKGVPLYPDGDLEQLAIDEALGLVADITTEWRVAVFIAMTPANLGHPADKSTEEHAAGPATESPVSHPAYPFGQGGGLPRVCTGSLGTVNQQSGKEKPGHGAGRGECVCARWHTMNTHTLNEWPGPGARR
jgi:hypothetical protein